MSSQNEFDAATEQALVDQCRRKDFQAFSKIVDAYQGRVLGFVRRMMRSEEDALDVTQEVFIKAYQAMDRFDGRSSLRTWLFRIARNLCIDRSRRSDRAPSTFSMSAGEEGDEPIDFADARWSPEDVLLNEELHSVIDQAISGMSEKLRTVLLLHDREDMAYEEIAAVVNVPVGTVKSRLFLARAHIQRVAAEYFNGGLNS